ncbi:MAG TPA: PAS domain S-box protein, partial [Sphingobacteriaceae bacterium]
MIAGAPQQCYLTFMLQPYKNSEGEVEGIFYFGIDVTEQVLARKRIEESKRRYMDLIQNLPVAVYTTAPDGKMQLYNKAAAELWGCNPELGKLFSCDCVEIFNAEGLPLEHCERPMHLALTSRVAFSNREILIKRSDGQFRNVLASPSPLFDDEGALYGGINVLIDITERKQAEDEIKRLSLIARNTDNAVMITDLCGKIEWVNAAFSKLTGFSYEEAVGRVQSALLHGEKTDPEIWARMNNNGLPGQTIESEILNYTKSGRPYWMEVVQQPLFDGSGKLTHLMLLGRDITERKDAYQKLVQSREKIQSFARQLNDVLEDERARIAREIHDEFGQQLAGLKMYLLSLGSYLVEGGEAVLDATMAAADTAMQSLRKFATELRPGILDTLGLIPSMEWLVEDFESKSGITCTFQLEGGRNQTIGKDVSICCFRICQEALTNILKHSGATFVTVELCISPERLFLRIADNGIGMRQDSLQDPFSMGLLGMRERAALVGGQFQLDSLPGHGTTLDLLVEL